MPSVKHTQCKTAVSPTRLTLSTLHHCATPSHISFVIYIHLYSTYIDILHMSLYYTHYEQHEYIGIYTHLIVFATLLSLLTLRVHTCIYTAHTHILHSIYYYVHTLYYVYNYTQESLYIIPTCIITYLMIYTTLYLSIHYELLYLHTQHFFIYTHMCIYILYIGYSTLRILLSP